MPPGPFSRRRDVLIGVLLTVLTVALYWQTRHFEFLNFDDPAYVTANPHVFRGITGENIVWAFTSFQASNWHPVTWLSHMLDCQLYGPRPGGHHFTNVLLHAANTVLIFCLFLRMTSAIWRSALVAAFFGWHPLHVESVAWIAERKDVLSTFFGLCALWMYVRKVQSEERGGSSQSHTRMYYGGALVLFSLALMSKPMLVTLPFVMLLLDFWPLKRVSPLRWRGIVLEKLPFLFLSAVACILTVRAQKEAILDEGSLPFGSRLVNAVMSYAIYLRKMFWPVDLAAYYPYRLFVPTGEIVGALLVLIIISMVSVVLVRRFPYLLCGWLWYLGTLVPVIGLVQVGAQSLADRYMYLPMVGVLVMVIFWGGDLASRDRYGPLVGRVACVGLMVACLGATWFQQKYWHDSETLFRRDLEVCPENNAMAHHCLGRALFLKGDDAGAIPHYEAVLKLLPELPDGHVSIANSLNRQGNFERAMFHYREAIRLDPKHAEAYSSLGNSLATQLRLDEAKASYLMALKLKPDYAQAHTRLGSLLMAQGDMKGALEHLTAATKIYPDFDEGQYYLANALADQKRFDEALVHFRAALKANPDYAAAYNDLAWMYATQLERTSNNLAESVRAAVQACALTHNTNASYLATLGIAYSESGRFPEAIATAEKASALATASGDVDVIARVQRQLALYRAGRNTTGRPSMGTQP